MRYHSRVPGREMDNETLFYRYLAGRWIVRDHSNGTLHGDG